MILNSGDINYSCCSAWWDFLLWRYPECFVARIILLIVTIVENHMIVLDVCVCPYNNEAHCILNITHSKIRINLLKPLEKNFPGLL